ILYGPPLSAALVHVDANNQTAVEDGSALRPFRTVAEAVAAADAGDEVRVARGTYVGPIRIESKVVLLRGGFDGGSSPDYEGNLPGDFTAPDAGANETTLQGVSTNSVVLLINSGASLVEGFTIRGGGGAHEDEFRVQGGGVFIEGGAVTIRGNVIEDNTT